VHCNREKIRQSLRQKSAKPGEEIRETPLLQPVEQQEAFSRDFKIRFSDNKLQFWFEFLHLSQVRSKNAITAGSAPICSRSRRDSCPASLSNGSIGKVRVAEEAV